MFDSAKRKLEWANQHIAKFQAAVAAFVETDPYTLSIEDGLNPNMTMAKIRFSKEVPTDIPLILGDAAHSLRSALDHAFWELMGLDGGTQNKHTAFPTHNCLVSYKAACKGIITPRNDTKEFIVALAAYKDGAGDALWRLACLNNTDKHRAISITARGATMPTMHFLSPDGQVVESFQGMTFGAACGFGFGRMKLPGHSLKFDENSKPTIDVVFMETDLGPMEPVGPALMHFANAVADTLGQFETFVSERP